MKQELLVELLQDRLSTLKVGLLVKGVEGICPRKIAAVLSTKIERHLYISASGYAFSFRCIKRYERYLFVLLAVFYRKSAVASTNYCAILGCYRGLQDVLRIFFQKLCFLPQSILYYINPSHKTFGNSNYTFQGLR